MVTVDDVARFLDAFAPLRLAEPWDNVGLLVGDRQRAVSRIMTCLTITGATVEEAVAQKADLIVVHHPLPFTALKRLTTDSPTDARCGRWPARAFRSTVRTRRLILRRRGSISVWPWALGSRGSNL